MDKREYGSFEEMLDDLDVDSEFKEEVKQEIASRRMTDMLFSMRSGKGITQQDVAAELKCTQSKVSKIERGKDGDLTVEVIAAYASLLKCDVEIAFIPQSARTVDRVKYHAFRIKSLLDQLGAIANEDETVAAGINSFFGEAAVNLAKIVADAAKSIPKNAVSRKPRISVTEFDDSDDDCDQSSRQGCQPADLAAV